MLDAPLVPLRPRRAFARRIAVRINYYPLKFPVFQKEQIK
jgi:hypothetical protein